MNKNESSIWKRPPGPLNVWKIVDGKRNGESTKFTIQEVPVNRYDDVLDHMCDYFLAEEAGCACLKIKDDPLAVADQKIVWKWVLEQGISIGMFTDNPNGGKSILVGVNILFVFSHSAKQQFTKIVENLKSATFIKYMMIMKQITDEVDLKSKLGTDECLFAFGLSVMPSFRGQLFGGKMLDAREGICHKYGLKATTSIFTSSISIKLAERSGFNLLLERDYDAILDEEKTPVFPNCKSKQLKYMSKKYC